MGHDQQALPTFADNTWTPTVDTAPKPHGDLIMDEVKLEDPSETHEEQLSEVELLVASLLIAWTYHLLSWEE